MAQSDALVEELKAWCPLKKSAIDRWAGARQLRVPAIYFNPSTHTRHVVDVTDPHKVCCSMHSMHHRCTRRGSSAQKTVRSGSAGVPVKQGMIM